MWFKWMYFVLQIIGSLHQAVSAKSEGARLFHILFGASVLIGYAHYIMGWF